MGRIALGVLIGVSGLACAGPEEAAPEPVAPRAPPVPLELPAPEAQPPSDQPRQVQETDLSEDVRARMDNISARFSAPSDAETFASVWSDADKLATEIESALVNLNTSCSLLDVEPLQKRFPWMGVVCVAEGTTPIVIFSEERWGHAALLTPQPEDEAFVALMSEAYSSARPGPWPNWIEQMSDVAGCSRLGDGFISGLLLQTDRIGASFAAPVGALRAELLRELSPSHTQYCKSHGPTPDVQLQAEAQRVLKEVQLTEAERAVVEAHVQAGLKGEAFSGG